MNSKLLTQRAIMLALFVGLNVVAAIPLAETITFRLGAVVLGACVLIRRDWKEAFLIGFIGNMIIDMYMGYGFWLNWDLVNGAMFAILAHFRLTVVGIIVYLIELVLILLLGGLISTYIYNSASGMLAAIIIMPSSLVAGVGSILLAYNKSFKEIFSK